MQVISVLNQLESAVGAQVSLAGGDAGLEAATNALLAALGPALRQAALDLAQQAAEEVRAQLPDRTV
ncbi:MAG: hypothetical protein ACRDVM_07440, partial [Acidimicrobiia bacterium]